MLILGLPGRDMALFDHSAGAANCRYEKIARQGVRCLRRAPRYSLQHILIEGPNWHQGLRRALVKAGIHHHDEIECRYDEHALPAKADSGSPLDFASVNKRTAEPKEVAVEISAEAVDLWCRRGVDPWCGDDLCISPVPALQDELADLG
jgi:hypothetical protein